MPGCAVGDRSAWPPHASIPSTPSRLQVFNPPSNYEGARLGGLALHLENVSRRYRRGHQEVQALLDVTLTVHPGTVLLGPTEDGKATRLHAPGGHWDGRGRNDDRRGHEHGRPGASSGDCCMAAVGARCRDTFVLFLEEA